MQKLFIIFVIFALVGFGLWYVASRTDKSDINEGVEINAVVEKLLSCNEDHLKATAIDLLSLANIDTDYWQLTGSVFMEEAEMFG